MKYIYMLLITMLVSQGSQAQFMTEKINKIGIKVGVGMNYMFNDGLNKAGANEQYRPIPRQGLDIGVYSRNRLTKVLRAFDYRSNVKNWYFQYELLAAFRGGNYKYYAATKDAAGNNTGYTQADTARFRKFSTFVVEMPFMFVWDYKDKQKLNLMFGLQTHYVINAELYKSNDPSPLFYASEQYDQLIQYKRWGWSAVGGFQIMGETVGFQVLAKYGFTDMNKRIAIGLDGNGNINRTIPGYLKPFSIDFNIVF